MKITVSQKDKKLKVSFKYNNTVDNYSVDKADDFLACVDKFLTKYHNANSNSFRNVKLEFHNSGLLTERVTRAIINGLSFNA